MSKYLQITLHVDVEIADNAEEGTAETMVDYVQASVKTHLGGLAVDVSVADWDVS